MIISTFVFYLLAFVILLAAIMVVVSKNLVHSALFMIVTFLGVAGIYIQLAADFLAIAQVLIYVGAISVLLIFGVMLTRRNNIKESNLFNKNKYPAAIVTGGLFSILAYYLYRADWKIAVGSTIQETTTQIADLLLNNYVISFEAAAVLLLVALIGAIVIGKGEGD